tara:strand:+ start:179 stop:853 length:675 start_codon:yes stop_codon:yes gene_type:complete
MAEFYMKDIRSWRDATLMLTFEERGYFNELLNLIYMYDDCLPDNDDLICKAMPVSKRQHKRLKEKLIELRLIEIKNNFYFNNRSTKELLKINSKSTINKLNSEKRWAKSRKTNDSSDASALQTVIPIVKVKVKSEKKEKIIIKNFDDWYSIYPRKEGKVAARKKYDTVVSRGDVTEEKLLRSIEGQLSKYKDTEPQFIPLPASWLNAGRWDDEVIAKKWGRGMI